MPSQTFLRNYPYCLTALYAALYCILLAGVFGFAHKPWTDEEHFYFTILEFIKQPDLTTLKHYEEMSTPLPFILYGIWGWLFHSDLATLRIFSLLIAFATIFSAFYLFKKTGLSTFASFMCVFILSLNPYFIGVSFFVYTDMLCELFMIWAFISLIQHKVWLSCIFLLLAILCRQYMVFFIPVIAVCIFVKEKCVLNVSLIKKLLPLLIPVLGLGILFLFWGGASPDNKLKSLYMFQTFTFHGDAFTAYMAASIVYTFPLLIFSLREIQPRQIYMTIPIATLWYLFFPVQGSQVAIESMIHIDTIGLVHKTTHLLPPVIEDGLWYVLFVTACFVFVNAFEKAIKNYRSLTCLVCSSWLFFILTMCLSYLTWEKYLLPILPMLLVYGGLLSDKFYLKQFDRIGK